MNHSRSSLHTESTNSVCHYSGVFMYFKSTVGHIIIRRAVCLKVLVFGSVKWFGLHEANGCVSVTGYTPMGTLSPSHHHDLGYHIAGDLVPLRVPYHRDLGYHITRDLIPFGSINQLLGDNLRMCRLIPPKVYNISRLFQIPIALHCHCDLGYNITCNMVCHAKTITGPGGPFMAAKNCLGPVIVAIYGLPRQVMTPLHYLVRGWQP